MTSAQMFEQAILLAMAILALGALSLILSVVLGRRRARQAFDRRFPILTSTRVPSRESIETNFGNF